MRTDTLRTYSKSRLVSKLAAKLAPDAMDIYDATLINPMSTKSQNPQTHETADRRVEPSNTHIHSAAVADLDRILSSVFSKRVVRVADEEAHTPPKKRMLWHESAESVAVDAASAALDNKSVSLASMDSL